MNYHVAKYRGETLLFSSAGLKDGAEVLFTGVATDPQEIAVRWIRRSTNKIPKYVTVSQRAFGCWEIDSDLKE